MKLTVVTVACCLLLTYPGTPVSGAEIRVCGRVLAETLSLLCGGEYYEPHAAQDQQQPAKRAVPVTLPGSLARWLLAQTTPKMEEFHSRPTRGVVDECCRKACSPAVLLSYCG